ncbi:MAG: M28 family peptidase [Candidatus Zixiibacteriota bacterium]|nr:MAG: M28 family peptidase [candidate division Zixibacteria bacterium]
MKKVILAAALLLALLQSGQADDLYRVTLHNKADADLLNSMDVEPLVWVGGAYVVLADVAASQRLQQSRLDARLVASGISGSELAMDSRLDRANTGRYEVVFEEEGIRILRVGPDGAGPDEARHGVFPIINEHLQIIYHPVAPPPEYEFVPPAGLEELIDDIEQDSLFSYVSALQAFPERLTESPSSRRARTWIARKFRDFGYDNVRIDKLDGAYRTIYNVIAQKPGTVYPEQEIVIGAHFDAVANSPGADDNGSGTAAVLEMARVLKDVDVPRTLVFVAFDGEEGWGYGSDHYVDEAVERNADITFMLNLDMIGFMDNNDSAWLYHGPEISYSLLWDEVARTYCGITGVLGGVSWGSDHWPFQQAGYDVCFAHEYIFSTVYHQSTDSTTYMDFDYMTRMVKASLATAFTVGGMLAPVAVLAVVQGGDGQSVQVVWHAVDFPELDHYRLTCFPTDQPAEQMTFDIPAPDTSYIVGGLTEGREYAFYVQAVAVDGRESLAFYHPGLGTPQSRPQAPYNVVALPMREAIRIAWQYENPELDFDRCEIVRDGAVAGHTTDTFYIDDDPSLGSDLHEYIVMSFDTEGEHSDTIGVQPAVMRAATLQADRILAVNRSSWGRTVDHVDETETGAFMREALSGYNFDYYSDTVAVTIPDDTTAIDLADMLDYGVVVVGAETGHYDDIGVEPEKNGILDTLAYYLSIGGRLVVFGRWGVRNSCDTLDYLANSYTYDDAYHDFFHIDKRILTLTTWKCYTPLIQADLIGARSTTTGYPDLPWDSLIALAHSDANIAGICPVTEISGIPFVSFCDLSGNESEVIYTYDSRDDSPLSEGEPVGWRHLGADYRYVWFDIPLSFFQRGEAVSALRRAVNDVMGSPELAGRKLPQTDLPQSYRLSQNYPNPFNPSTIISYSIPQQMHVEISIYNILGRRLATLVDETKPAGTHRVVWDGANSDGQPVASGIYMYRMKAGSHSQSKKMLLLR